MGAVAKINRRGACPALAAPMQTGDGLLARLNPMSQGLPPRQLIGLCESAERHGNGIVEVTSRGSLQVRGLTASSAAELADDINALSISVQTGTVVATGPLAGIDASEVADPRPLAHSIRAAIAQRGLSGKLAPKVSVVADGGGLWRLNGLQADVRCEAVEVGLWRVEMASAEASTRLLGTFTEEQAGEATLHVLEELARLGSAGRARDLPGPTLEMRDRSHENPLGAFDLGDGHQAVAVALPFGSTSAGSLAAFATIAERLGVREFRPAPPRSLILLLDAPNADSVLDSASRLGFVTDEHDPMMRIFACPGAPACTFGHFDTRRTAADIAHAAPSLFTDGNISMHVSGCSKGCAHPSSATLTLVGDEKSVGIVVGGTARDLPVVHSGPKRLTEALARLDAEGLARLGAHELSALLRLGEE